MNRKIILFGCGNGGKNTLHYLRKKYDIVAFIDNNPAFHGSLFEGVSVISPDELSHAEYDLIFISSMYTEEISHQLMNELNVLPSKIRFINKDVLEGVKANILTELFFTLLLMILVWLMALIFDFLIK